MRNTTTENYFLEKQSTWSFSKSSQATSSTQIFLPNVGPDIQHEAIPPAPSLNLDSSELKEEKNYSRGKKCITMVFI